jgi:hypothetical protein
LISLTGSTSSSGACAIAHRQGIKVSRQSKALRGSPACQRSCGGDHPITLAMSKSSSGFNENYEPVSPVDIVSGAKRPRFVVIEDEKQARSATRSVRTNSSSSTLSLKTPRTARFAEATTVHSPVKGPNESRSPFADPPKMENEPKPSDIGFGYISNDTVEQQATMNSDPNGQAGTPLKSALKTPGTPGRLLNPLSPTFREEQILEKEEQKTEISQAKDLV